MKIIKILLGTIVAMALGLLALGFVLWVKPPDILRVGANYSAKIVCSNVFLAGRDPDEVLRTDVQAPGVAILRLMRVSVDRERRVVRAGLLGFIGDGLAVSRPAVGCAAVPDGNLEFAAHVSSVTARVDADVAATEPRAPAAPVPAPASAPAPADCFWMEGHDGQSIAVIPSRELVIVRLGLTPVRDHYQPQPLVAAVLQAAR